ncbi:MAG: hypothetical protein IKS15_02600 [Opitutales bacterium]|nr:hypothetical protein [Opitutales bacterium]
MKINYWHYWFEKYEIDSKGKKFLNPQNRYTFDLPSLLVNFSKIEDINFKRSIRENEKDDNILVLSHHNGNAFIFLKTKYSEIYKTIKEKDLTIGDIESALKQSGESIAFASYFAINKEIITMGNTLSSPSIKSFSTFVTNLLKKLGIINLVLKYAPVCGTISRDDLAKFQYIGATEIRIPIESSQGKSLWEGMTGKPSDKTQARYLTIKISLEKKGNLKEDIENIVDSNLSIADKFKIKAKDDMNSRFIDYFLTSQGQKNNVVPKPKSDSDALHEVKQAIADDSFSIDNLKRGFDYEPLDKEHPVNDFIANSNWNDYI